MFRYERSILINAPAAKVYEFHLFTPNAGLIQPAGIKVLDVQQPEEVREGAEFDLKVSAYGLPQHWRVRWAEVAPPSPIAGADGLQQAALTDEALRGPFKHWRHRHEFTETQPGVTRLRDAIEYLPKWGPLGRAVQPLIQFQLDTMFYTRQRLTKRILEASLAPTTAPLDLAQANAFYSVQVASEKQRGDD